MSKCFVCAAVRRKSCCLAIAIGIVLTQSITVVLAQAGPEGNAEKPAEAPPAVAPAAVESPSSQEVVFDYPPALLDLYKSKKLLSPESYPALRKLYVQRFVVEHAEELRKGLGDDYEDMKGWCRVNREIFEEFCIAIEEKGDNIAGAFSILNTLRKTFPDDLKKYHNLAIAAAVVWEDGGRQIDLKTMGAAAQARAKYNRRNTANTVDNFRYYIDNADKIPQDLAGLPWEALVHVVNQRTPIDQRQWALEKYGKKPSQIGKAYEAVPYDNAMWSTRFKECRMRGKEYSLQNILEIGAVCTQRSDYCTRVGASMGIPGSAFHGTNDNTFNHQWYTWIDITSVTPSAIKFEIKNAGRYPNHYYFFGRTTSPQTGGRLFDYEFALDYEVLARDILRKRQAVLALRVFPWMVEKEKLDAGQQLALMEDIIDLEPFNRNAWFYLLRIVKRMEGDETLSRNVQRLVGKLCSTFKAYPDIIWRVGSSLAMHFKEIAPRKKVYEQMAASFTAANRRDLFCSTQMLCADILIEQGKPKEAMKLLIECATAFPDEGRYVPKLLDKIDELGTATPASRKELVAFYENFFPHALKHQGGKPVKYTSNLYARTVKVFEESDNSHLVEAAKTAVEAYRAKRKKG